jgi:kynurenine formamidase
MPTLWDQLCGARVYDLGQPYFTGMPHWPAHPPFLFGLTKRHGDMVGPAGNSSAADAMALGSHVGTHIDALCHFSCGGMLHGGHAVEDLQSYGGGLKKFSVDTIGKICNPTAAG